MSHFINPDRLLCPAEASDYLGMSIDWLERQRGLRLAPDFIRLGGKKGGKIKYRQSVLDALIVSGTVQTSTAV